MMIMWKKKEIINCAQSQAMKIEDQNYMQYMHSGTYRESFIKKIDSTATFLHKVTVRISTGKIE